MGIDCSIYFFDKNHSSSRSVPVSILPATKPRNVQSVSAVISGQELSHYYTLPVGNVIPAHQVTRLIKQEVTQHDASSSDLSICSSISNHNSSYNSTLPFGQKSLDQSDLANSASPEKKMRQRWTSQEDFRLSDLVRKNGQDEVCCLKIFYVEYLCSKFQFWPKF